MSCEQACFHMRNTLVCAVSWADTVTQQHDGTQGHISVFKRERAEKSPSLLAFTQCSPLRLRTLCLNKVSEGRKLSLQSPNLGEIWKVLWSQPVQSLSKRQPSAEHSPAAHTVPPTPSGQCLGSHSSAHAPFLSLIVFGFFLLDYEA